MACTGKGHRRQRCRQLPARCAVRFEPSPHCAFLLHGVHLSFSCLPLPVFHLYAPKSIISGSLLTTMRRRLPLAHSSMFLSTVAVSSNISDRESGGLLGHGMCTLRPISFYVENFPYASQADAFRQQWNALPAKLEVCGFSGSKVYGDVVIISRSMRRAWAIARQPVRRNYTFSVILPVELDLTQPHPRRLSTPRCTHPHIRLQPPQQLIVEPASHILQGPCSRQT